MISEDQWIDLPVGYNLEDHTNVSIGEISLIWKTVATLREKRVLTETRPTLLSPIQMSSSMTSTKRGTPQLRAIRISISVRYDDFHYFDSDS